MSKNPVVPYAIIAIVGIALVIVLAYIGVNQREAIRNPEANTKVEDATNPEDIYKSSCASCHGGDLTGVSAPSLTEIGSKYSADEIKNIINNGKGSMPAGMATAPQAEELAKWLVENYK